MVELQDNDEDEAYAADTDDRQAGANESEPSLTEK